MFKLITLQDRIKFNNFTIEKSQRETFISTISKLPLNIKSQALSVGVGNGIWDYYCFSKNKNISKIIATDIVSNPVNYKDQSILLSMGQWKYVQTLPEKKLPFANSMFDLIYHLDVLEHVSKPYLFLTEQYRVLKKDGYIYINTPNLFRPANIIKLLACRLNFPYKFWSDDTIGDYVHILEYHKDQLLLILKEVGFTNIQIFYDYFGLHQMNLTFSYHPHNRFGKLFAQSLSILAQK